MTIKAIRDLNVAVIGAGRHASTNLHPAISLAGARIGCVLTRSSASARAAATSLGAERYYHDIENMLGGEKLDAVLISIEPEDQARITIRCLQEGIPVFVEKPLGMNAEDARDVLAASVKHKTPVMVAFMKRFAPAYQRLTQLIADKERFGEILTIDATFSFCPWTPELREDSFLQQGAIHMLDFLQATFGKATVASALSNSSKSDIGLAYTLRFDHGAVCCLSLSATQARSSTNERVTVVGTKGWADAKNLKTVDYCLDGNGSVVSEPWDFGQRIATGTPATSFLYEQGFFGEVHHFLQSIAHESSPTPSAAENVETMTLCDDMIAMIDS